MKLVIASDIHGAADACARLMSAIEAESPDRVVLLGDLLYHGPRNDLLSRAAQRPARGLRSQARDRDAQLPCRSRDCRARQLRGGG